MHYARMKAFKSIGKRKVPRLGSYVEDLLGELGIQHTLLLLGGSHIDAGSLNAAQSGARLRWGGGVRIGECDVLRLQEMLALADVTEGARLLVVILCPLCQTLELFYRVQKHRLENVWVTWLVFPGNSEDMRRIQGSLNDGIQVLAAVESNHTILYQSAADVRGNIGFTEIGKWKQRSCDQHRVNATNTRGAENNSSQRTSRGRPGCSSGSPGGARALNEPHWGLKLWSPAFLTPRDLRQENLEGRRLRVSAVNNWPFFGLRRDGAGNLVPDSGIDVSVLTELAKVMNFTALRTTVINKEPFFAAIPPVSPDRVGVPTDGQWGKRLPNGSWSGIMGMVTRREVSFAIDEITTTEDREEAVALTHPYYLESSAVLSRAPAPTGRALAVFSPFTSTVWMLVTLCIVLAGPVFSLITNTQRQLRLRRETKPLSFCDTCFNVFKVFFLQTDSAAPTTTALRLIAIFWYLFSFNFIVLYSAKLTAVLASPTYERPIDSLADLLEAARSDRVLPVILKGSSIHTLFEESESGVYRNVFQYFTSESYALTRDEGVDKVLEEGGAVIESTLALEIRAARRGRHQFHIGREVFFPQAYSVACVTGSRLAVAFDFWLGCMVEGGLINKWKTEELEKLRSDATGDRHTVISPITLVHLQGAFFLYALGCGAAALALLVEYILSKKHN